MLKYVLLSFVLFFFGGLYSQNYVSEYKTGARIWKYEGGLLINYFTNSNALQLDQFYIRDCSTGMVLYEASNNQFKNKNGTILFTVKNDTLRNYEDGKLAYLMDAEYLVDASTNIRLYKLEGVVPVEIVIAAILQGLR